MRPLASHSLTRTTGSWSTDRRTTRSRRARARGSPRSTPGSTAGATTRLAGDAGHLFGVPESFVARDVLHEQHADDGDDRHHHQAADRELRDR